MRTALCLLADATLNSIAGGIIATGATILAVLILSVGAIVNELNKIRKLLEGKRDDKS